MAGSSPRGALVGLRAGAMTGAASVALTLGIMTALVLLGGADLQRDLIGAHWMRHVVIAAGVGAGVGVVLGGIVGAVLGRLGQGPMSGAIAGGVLALAAATVVYQVRLHAPLEDVLLAGAGAAAVGAAVGIVVWLPFSLVAGVRSLLRRQGR